jgi:3-hydroxyacyl-CoA dehydrogenase/enoyl-CoA hydratase/carnithine racemase
MTGSQNRIVTTTEIEPGIHSISIAHPAGQKNRLDRPTLEQFNDAVQQLINGDQATGDQASGVKGIIICSSILGHFMAGADLAAIRATTDYSDQDIAAFCKMGRTIFQQLFQCDAFTVAAIDGAADNGGLELAMWCDFRIATTADHTRFSYSDIVFGLVPAWGGSVLLPRLTSVPNALKMIATGESLSAEQALAEGLVDAVVKSDRLLPAAVKRIQESLQQKDAIADRRRAKTQPLEFDLSSDAALRDAIAVTASAVGESEDIYPFAPTVAMEHVLRTAGEQFDDALQSETAAVVQTYGSPANAGLLNHHFLAQRNRAEPGLVDLNLTPQPIKKLGIIGAGVMGRSIAHVALSTGIDVALIDASQNSIAIARAELSPPEFEVPADRQLVVSDQYSVLSDVDLVIEAVVETISVKASVHEKIQAATRPGVLIASNTSSIPIEAMAENFAAPDRFCGIHFCHPEVMSLVEVIAGPESSEQAVADAVGFIRQLGKMPIAINDGPGFVVNRLLAAMLNQALGLLVEGLTISRIDEAMVEFGFRAGPFQIIDIIGADTCMYAGRVMYEHGLACVSLLPILPKLVKHNRLGRKTLIGFYIYPDHRADAIVDPGLDEIVSKYQRSEVSPEIAKLSHSDIALRILAPVVLEATRIIEEEGVNDLRDIELAFIHGLSFPQHRGGLLFWADEVGIDKIVKTLLRLTKADPRLQPTELLSAMRQEDRKFYSRI